MREVQITQAGLLDFSDFSDLSWEQDAAGDVYPQIWDEIEKLSDTKKKDKNGIKKGIGK